MFYWEKKQILFLVWSYLNEKSFFQWQFLLLKVLLSFPRMKSTASCKMNLRNYPMDDQICHLALESCEYLQTITSFCSFYLSVFLLQFE